ncbi:hypothetical protein [Nocardioides lianchengensis]|uniref:Uncharacterized protein n=1 Tax=Nocardioides lianchengensis TaxID=1045774 RepID=A0A1G6LJX4_9ACTN|nr:hypothetical protein [Nocardioides lianchengensis]NYG12542.1 hypothetical protein [Nocardioides lianchengensis]SDC43055.1 hypothetical protein SAMN05421872_102259 [Nocardioides lianchengensis]
MTDDRLDHEREADVRRLLAEARYDEPVPDDVAARLDRVLAELVDEGPPEKVADQHRVIDLAAQRRRRRVRQLLVAAVAVGVIGVGLGQVGLPSTFQADMDGSSAGGSAADSGGDSAEAEAEGPAAAAGAPSALDEASPLQRDAPLALTAEPLVVEDEDFGSEAQLKSLRRTTLQNLDATLSQEARSSAAPESDESRSAEGYAATPTWFTCQPGPFGAGRLIAVQYDGQPAVLAVRPSTGDSSVVELLRCGSGAVLRSATVPVP